MIEKERQKASRCEGRIKIALLFTKNKKTEKEGE